MVDLEAASGSNMSKKKAPKGAFHGPAGGFFVQKKKVVLGNVKHSSDEKDIFLKSGSGISMFSDVESLSGDDEDVGMNVDDGSSLLGLAMNTSKAKHVNSGVDFGFPLNFPNYIMDKEVKSLLPLLVLASSEKKKSDWVNPVVFFALDINFSTAKSKLVTAKTQSTFTSEESMKKTILLASKNRINVNSDLKKQKICSDWAVVIKKIPMDMSKDMIVATVAKFGEIKSIKIQLIDSVHVAMAMEDHETWASRDQFRALLFTLPIGTTVHDLGTLLDKAGGKTCIINRSLNTGNRICCAVVGFESEKDLDTAFHTELIFGGVQLSWASLDLVKCEKCGCFGHSTLEYDVLVVLSSEFSSSFKKPASGFDCFQLAKLYAKKKVSISRPAAFGGKSWAQVMSLDSFSGGSPFGSGLLSGGPPLSLDSSNSQVDRLVSVILKKLSFIELVPLAFPSYVSSLAVSVPSALVVDSDMALDDMFALLIPYFSSGSGSVDGLSLSGSKVFTSKLGSLESKIEIGSLVFWFRFVPTSVIPMSDLIWKFATCNIWGINVPAKQADIVHWHVSSGNMVSFIAKTKLRFFSESWIKDKFDGIRIFISGLDIGYLGAGVVIIMDNSLACHVSRVDEVPGHLISIWLLFKGKLSVMILGLYTGASLGTRFAQTPAVNFLIAKAVNSSTFVVLGGNFNKNNSGKSASFRFYLGLGLVNSFAEHSLVKTATWSNSRGVKKTIDFILVNRTLSFAIVKHCVNSVSDFFDTDHKFVMVLVGLDGLLDDCWKFKIKDTNGAGWFCFKECSSTKMLKVKRRFLGAAAGLDLDAMWFLLEKVVMDSADEIFSRHWFCNFQCSKNKYFSKFLGLELLVTKIVKCLASADTSALDASKAFVLENMVCGGQKVEDLLSYLLLVVLDYLVVDDELILEPEEVRSSVDKIIESWTQKCVMPMVLPDLWTHQYAPLNYVKNDAFSNVMSAISMGELLLVTNDLPDGKAAGLSGIPNELWKHDCDETARKILSDCISLACSTSMQFSVFAVGSVVEDVLEKNRKIWLVLQDMQKAYDSVGWPHLKASLQHIKMCERFIGFFGNIHKDRVNRVMTDFGLSDGYSVHDGLDQVKRHEHLCGYRVDSKFVAKTDRVEDMGGMMSYLAVGVFINDTIWIRNCQTSTQYTLNIASKFFEIHDISINNNKTVVIPINQDVRIASLSICGQPISIAKKGETHRYLSIFLSTKGLSKPSVSKAHSVVCFFVNVVLKKAITDKQFSYLVLAVLQPIGLKSKAGLLHDFPDAALHHPSLYGLKTFEQVQSEGKIAALVTFSNASGVLKHLFNHRFLDLQVLGWTPLNPLQFSVKLYISPANNFLAGIVKIFLCNELSLANNFLNAFCSPGHFPLLLILGSSEYFNFVCSLKCFEVAFGDWLLDKRNHVLD
ncbi:hypothetical protein G9A89_002254 [Geosiphon pyriformis]|nr:hypothetical protein G9A89_002254 [Geosiphon pyriformis]